jgi:hypothetical protein
MRLDERDNYMISIVMTIDYIYFYYDDWGCHGHKQYQYH